LTDAWGNSRHLTLAEPFFIFGRVDPLVVTLPAGATFSFPTDLDKYWPLILKQQHEDLSPGDYSLVAQFTGAGVTQAEANLDVKGLALMPYWKGTVTSNQLAFTVPSR
jgi:hypothetical protein